MSFLDQLTKGQSDLLITLPYRVGLYISQSDASGGDDSDEAELQVLDNLITAYSQEVFGAETVQYIINQTVKRKSEWAYWSDDLDNIEDECVDAIDILLQNVDEKEVNAFKHHLIEVGESVALAFREYGEETPLMEKVKTYMFYFKGKMHAKKFNLPYKEWEQFINISMEERRALRLIADSLGIVYI